MSTQICPKCKQKLFRIGSVVVDPDVKPGKKPESPPHEYYICRTKDCPYSHGIFHYDVGLKKRFYIQREPKP